MSDRMPEKCQAECQLMRITRRKYKTVMFILVVLVLAAVLLLLDVLALLII